MGQREGSAALGCTDRVASQVECLECGEGYVIGRCHEAVRPGAGVAKAAVWRQVSSLDLSKHLPMEVFGACSLEVGTSFKVWFVAIIVSWRWPEVIGGNLFD